VTTALEGNAAITGIGQSEVGRRLGRDPLALTVDACMQALEDAGLERSDIDGLSTYPGAMVPGAPGFSGAGVSQVQEALRLDLDWYCGGLEQPGQFGSVINACMAVATGLARHVLCFRTVWESTAQGEGHRAGLGTSQGADFRATGDMQWSLPFGAASAACWIAMYAQRHFIEFGTTREQLAWIALNDRRNAALNPAAVYRDPMTLDDYMSVRMISTPFCLYDCDVPVDGATAVIVSAVEPAADTRNPPLMVQGVGSAIHGRPSWDQWDDLTTMALRDAATMMWKRSDLAPADVQVAELYDGFSFIALAWLEALGFCPRGQGGAFIDGGQRIALDGKLPLNTGGGQLSGGRLHGYGLLHEACLQLWGRGEDRQVAGDPAVAVAAAGGGPLAGCLLLARD
jgi:acetyl-CoA acetyltransferase